MEGLTSLGASLSKDGSLEEITDLDSIGPEVGKGVIRNIGWSLGNYCNAKCEHCYSWQVRQSEQELSRGDVDTIEDKLVELGVQTVNIGGNEPIFTNGPKWRESLLPYIIETLHDRRLDVGVTTSGITAKLLYEHFPGAFQQVDDWDVSFDSPYMLEHDSNRGISLFREAVEASRILAREKKTHSMIVCAMNMYLRRPKIDEARKGELEGRMADLELDPGYLGLKFTGDTGEERVPVSNFDREHLEALVKLANELDAEVRINTLKPTDQHHYKMVLGVGQDYAGFHFLIGNSDHIVVMGEPRYAGLTGTPGHGCPCGSSSMRIHSKTPLGAVPVSPCVYMHEFKATDLLTDPILGNDGIVNRPEFRAVRGRTEDVPAYCRDNDCAMAETCRGGCAAQAYFSKGDYAPEYVNRDGDVAPDIAVTRKAPFRTERTANGLRFYFAPGGRQELGRLNKPDPYSPAIARNMGIQLPVFPQGLEIGHDGVRVHENYLCTWIGKPKG